jgi:UDP-N-acetyl-D-glucosamine dehydrogenase
LALIELIEARGGKTEFHDPHVAEIPRTREHGKLAGRKSVPLDLATVGAFDAVLISTDHDAVDYRLLAEHAKLIVDTRNAMAKRGFVAPHIIKA